MTRGKIQVVVKDIKIESPIVKSFKLFPINGVELPRFMGGSYITTYVQPPNKKVLARNYSLISNPKKTEYYQIAIRLSNESKGGSRFWHNDIKEGNCLHISYPKNKFSLSFEAKHHVFFAAGIGITPFLSMIEDVKKNGETFELHYAAKSKELCSFYQALKARYPNEVTFYFSENEQKMTTALLKNQLIGTHVYFCGSEEMMKQFSEAAISFGYPEKRIHFERFSPPNAGTMYPFKVQLKKSNQSFEVPEGETLLEALVKNKIDAPYACTIGGCGSCQIGVLEGEVDHRDEFLTDSERRENSVILTCVSRGKNGCLTLDL